MSYIQSMMWFEWEWRYDNRYSNWIHGERFKQGYKSIWSDERWTK